MKVAIIGAGLSGLACAHELIRQGISPTVFERKSYLGEILDLPVIVLDMFNMPINNPLKYLEKKFDLKIEPNFPLNEIIIHSPNKNLTVNANIGFILKRGKYIDSIESQIMRSINIPINFNSHIDFRDIEKDFDHIVVCTATPNVAKDLNLFKNTFESNVRIANISGDFKVYSMTAWLNTAFAKSGFAYLVPNGEKDARLILITTHILPNELDHYWNKFLEIAKIEYKINNITDLTHIVGHATKVQHKNILLCGNAAGFIDDILGFGSMKALLSGVLAAKSIIKNKNYNRMAQKLTEDIKQTSKLRTTMNSYVNKDFDNFITIMGLPGIKQLIYNNPFFKATNGVRFAEIYNLFKGF